MKENRQKLIKTIILIIISIILFVFPFYAFLHETGHFLMTLFFHGKVKEVSLFPLSYVLVDTHSVTPNQLYIISLSGAVFPCLFSFIPMKKPFYLWFLGILFKLNGIFSCFVNCFLLFLSNYGWDISQTDLGIALKIHNDKTFIFGIFVFLLFLQFLVLIWSKPLTMLDFYLP